MSEVLKQTLHDLKAQQLSGEHTACPRCGQDVMNPIIHRNAQSRYADIYVCDDCGTSEAMLDFMNNPLPLPLWACFKAEYLLADFKALPGELVWERLQKMQLPYLIQLYERWQDTRGNEDFDIYRLEAHRHCAGLDALWSHPFQAAYRVKDGQLLIRFRTTEAGTEVAFDLIPKPRR